MWTLLWRSSYRPVKGDGHWWITMTLILPISLMHVSWLVVDSACSVQCFQAASLPQVVTRASWCWHTRELFQSFLIAVAIGISPSVLVSYYCHSHIHSDFESITEGLLRAVLPGTLYEGRANAVAFPAFWDGMGQGEGSVANLELFFLLLPNFRCGINQTQSTAASGFVASSNFLSLIWRVRGWGSRNFWAT